MSFGIKILKICMSILGIGMTVSCLGGCSMDQIGYQELSNRDKILYSFINQQGQMIGKKYNMKPCASGLGGRIKTSMMALSFDKCGDPLTEEEARQLIVNCVDDFLEAANAEEKLKPFLANYPLTAKNLDLTIFSRDKDQKIHYFPHIAVFFDSKGKIGFLTEHPSTKSGYHTEKYETYEESVAILKGENQHKGPENNIE